MFIIDLENGEKVGVITHREETTYVVDILVLLVLLIMCWELYEMRLSLELILYIADKS